MLDISGLDESRAPYTAARARTFRKVNEDEEWLRRVLRAAFPCARSETDLCDRVAAYLRSRGRDVDPRTVRLWLRGDTAPQWRFASSIMALAGPDAIGELTGRRQ